jgi:hypothetical protein
MIRVIGCVLAGLACMLAGCSTYIDDFQYSPRPAVASLSPMGQPPATQPAPGQPAPQQPPPALSVLATVIGVHRADSKLGIPDSVEIRLRIDNNGPENVIFNPQTLTLINGQLVPFGQVIAPQPVGLDPHQTAYVTAYFPFPPGHGVGDTYMATLQLNWQVQIGGQTVAQTVSFQRVWSSYYYGGPVYYSPAYVYPTYPVVVGVGIGFHGRWR